VGAGQRADVQLYPRQRHGERRKGCHYRGQHRNGGKRHGTTPFKNAIILPVKSAGALTWINGQSPRPCMVLLKRDPGSLVAMSLLWIIRLLLTLPALVAAKVVAYDLFDFGFVGTSVVFLVIIGFAVLATGWTIRHDV
jgi:hypothetical protein